MNSPLSSPQAILFDWDNTLVDTLGIIREAMNHTLVTFGLEPWSEEEAHEKIQYSGREAMEHIFGDSWEKAGACFYEYHDKHHLDHLKFLPGAQELLFFLKDEKIPMGVVSNKRGDVLRQQVVHLLGDSFFEATIGAGDTERDKPAPDMAMLAIQQMHVQQGKDVWFLGDSPVDWRCAKSAGCFAVSIGHKTGNHEEMDLSVANCPDFQKILKDL